MSDSIIQKAFYKWDIISTKITKNELKGLAEFIYKYLENN